MYTVAKLMKLWISNFHSLRSSDQSTVSIRFTICTQRRSQQTHGVETTVNLGFDVDSTSIQCSLNIVYLLGWNYIIFRALLERPQGDLATSLKNVERRSMRRRVSWSAVITWRCAGLLKNGMHCVQFTTFYEDCLPKTFMLRPWKVQSAKVCAVGSPSTPQNHNIFIWHWVP
jgi:hypothetical protein